MELDRRQVFHIAGAAGVALTLKDSGLAEHRATERATTELFLDNERLEATPGVSRRLHPAKKHLLNPVTRPERWCEGTYLQPYSTMYDTDERRFKMWARAGSDAKAGFVGGNAAWMNYYTSTDGVRWEKPDLGLFEVGGRRDHNIVFASDQVPVSVSKLSYGPEKFIEPERAMTPQGKKAFFWSVNKHPRPRDPSEAYVALAIVQDHRRGAHIATSPDGIRWSCAATPFWQTPHDIASTGDDCLMHLMFDEARDRWVIYRRIIPEFSERMVADESDRKRAPIDRYNRSYAYAETDDLKEWRNHRFILAMDADDPADTELYQFGCHKFGATYVGYASIFHLRRPQPIDVQLMTSRDGLRFTRVCRGESLIAAGPLGYYDYMAMSCSQPRPLVVDDTLYIYYAALNFPHDVDESESKFYTGGAALATLKRDRFASLETGTPDAEPCRIITKPLPLPHPKLYLNGATWGAGSIRVELLTRDWQPIPGFTAADAIPIQGDALDHPVAWKGQPNITSLVGRETRLKIHLSRARVHAVTWSDTDRPLHAVEATHRIEPRADSAPRAN